MQKTHKKLKPTFNFGVMPLNRKQCL